MPKFVQTLVDGLSVGSLYALIALGYTMVYGILKFINFAHSDIFVLGAWISLAAAVGAGWSTTGQFLPVPTWLWVSLCGLTGVALLMTAAQRLIARFVHAEPDRLTAQVASAGGCHPSPRAPARGPSVLTGAVRGFLGWRGARTLTMASLAAWLPLLLYHAAGAVRAAAGPELSAAPGGVPICAAGLLSALLVLLCAVSLVGWVGFGIERLAYRPLRTAPRLNVLITAIGVSLLLQNVGQLQWVFGTQPRRMPSLLPDVTLARLAGVNIHLVDVIATGTAVILMLLLERLVFHTRVGRAMRAVSFDTRIAALMGVAVDRVISFTFVLGSSLAAAAGFLYAMKYPGLNQSAHMTWLLLGLKAFVAAVVGGIGNIRGAMLGGFLIGLIELFGAAYLSPQLRDVYVFSLLIAVLLLRPSGILGRVAVEKV